MGDTSASDPSSLGERRDIGRQVNQVARLELRHDRRHLRGHRALAGPAPEAVQLSRKVARRASGDGWRVALAGDRNPVVLGPDRLPLRADIVNPIPMVRTPAQMAPAFMDGFYVVPKLGGLSEE